MCEYTLIDLWTDLCLSAVYQGKREGEEAEKGRKGGKLHWSCKCIHLLIYDLNYACHKSTKDKGGGKKHKGGGKEVSSINLAYTNIH